MEAGVHSAGGSKYLLCRSRFHVRSSSGIPNVGGEEKLTLTDDSWVEYKLCQTSFFQGDYSINTHEKKRKEDRGMKEIL